MQSSTRERYLCAGCGVALVLESAQERADNYAIEVTLVLVRVDIGALSSVSRDPSVREGGRACVTEVCHADYSALVIRCVGPYYGISVPISEVL